MLLHNTTCLNCNAHVAPEQPLYEINHRYWCEACARPYMRTGGGIGAALASSLRFFVVMILGSGVWLFAMFFMRAGFIPATLMAGVIAVLLFKLLSIGGGGVDVSVRKVEASERL